MTEAKYADSTSTPICNADGLTSYATVPPAYTVVLLLTFLLIVVWVTGLFNCTVF